MAGLSRFVCNFQRCLVGFKESTRVLSTSSPLMLKESKLSIEIFVSLNFYVKFFKLKNFVWLVDLFFYSTKFIYFTVKEEKKGKVLTVEGVYIEDPKRDKILPDAATGACPICSTGLDVKHTVSRFFFCWKIVYSIDI